MHFLLAISLILPPVHLPPLAPHRLPALHAPLRRHLRPVILPPAPPVPVPPRETDEGYRKRLLVELCAARQVFCTMVAG